MNPNLNYFVIMNLYEKKKEKNYQNILRSLVIFKDILVLNNNT